MRKVISHIMNQILTTDTRHERRMITAVDEEAHNLPSFTMHDGTDWLDWLKNVDWTKGAEEDFC